jgi:sulfur-oxidizing protein SoxZ
MMSDNIRLKTTKVDGGVVVRALINHPMNPRRKDPRLGLMVPGHFIEEVTVQLNGKTVLSGDWSGGVARDPYLSFKIRQAGQGDVIRLSWTDNAGNSAASQVTVS